MAFESELDRLIAETDPYGPPAPPSDPSSVYLRNPLRGKLGPGTSTTPFDVGPTGEPIFDFTGLKNFNRNLRETFAPLAGNTPDLKTGSVATPATASPTTTAPATDAVLPDTVALPTAVSPAPSGPELRSSPPIPSVPQKPQAQVPVGTAIAHYGPHHPDVLAGRAQAGQPMRSFSNTETEQKAVDSVTKILNAFTQGSPNDPNMSDFNRLEQIRSMVSRGEFDQGGLMAGAQDAEFIRNNKALINRAIDNLIEGGGGALRGQAIMDFRDQRGLSSDANAMQRQRIDSFNRLFEGAPGEAGPMIPTAQLGSDFQQAQRESMESGGAIMQERMFTDPVTLERIGEREFKARTAQDQRFPGNRNKRLEEFRGRRKAEQEFRTARQLASEQFARDLATNAQTLDAELKKAQIKADSDVKVAEAEGLKAKSSARAAGMNSITKSFITKMFDSIAGPKSTLGIDDPTVRLEIGNKVNKHIINMQAKNIKLLAQSDLEYSSSLDALLYGEDKKGGLRKQIMDEMNLKKSSFRTTEDFKNAEAHLDQILSQLRSGYLVEHELASSTSN